MSRKNDILNALQSKTDDSNAMCGMDNIYYISFGDGTSYYIAVSIEKYLDPNKYDIETAAYFIGFQTHMIYGIIDETDLHFYLSIGKDLHLIMLPFSKRENLHILKMDRYLYNMFDPYMLEELFYDI
jgi:hypothetical protein